MEEDPRAERKLQGIERKLTQKVNSHIEQKSVPLIDFTYVSIITGGILKGNKNLIYLWRTATLKSINFEDRTQVKIDG